MIDFLGFFLILLIHFDGILHSTQTQDKSVYILFMTHGRIDLVGLHINCKCYVLCKYVK